MDYCRENIFNYWSCCPSINLSNYVTKNELEEALSGISGCDLTEIEETIDSMQDEIEENAANIEALQGIISSLADRVSILENTVTKKANESALTPIWDAIYELSGDTPTPTPIEYLTFKAASDGTFSFTNPLEYSIDNGNTWIELAANTATPTVTSGNSIKFKADLVANTNGIGTFSSTGQFEVSGNPMSLTSGDNISVYQFKALFSGCTGLTSAEHLILNKDVLNDYSYQGMFYGCTSLTTAPQLPALALGNGCYSQMFTNCTSLTTVPALHATTLANGCCSSMFNGCTSLTTAPALPATTLANSCYQYMFNGCTSLTTAPELPATTLANYCYQYMFNGCSSLNYIKCLATDISGYLATQNWVNNVASTGTFVKNKDMNDWTIDSTSGVPIGWTVVDDGVEPTPDTGETVTGKAIMYFNDGTSRELSSTGASDTFINLVDTFPDFTGQSALTKVVLGNICYGIGYEAFANCTNLTAVTLNEGLVTIGVDSFKGCSSLRALVIPSTVEHITDTFIADCNLDSITYLSSTPPDVNNNNYQGANASANVIYVPAANLSTYQSTWSDISNKIQAM